MADPGPQEPRISRFDDPTRDIRLPPAPGSPPLVVRPEWSSYTARQEPVAAERGPEERIAAATPDSAAPTADVGKPAARRPLDLLADEPTDQLVPPRASMRDRTLELAHGQAAPVRSPVAPQPAVPARDGGRRWPWVLLTLLPIIVIVGSGIWLFVLLSHA